MKETSWIVLITLLNRLLFYNLLKVVFLLYNVFFETLLLNLLAFIYSINQLGHLPIKSFFVTTVNRPAAKIEQKKYHFILLLPG